VLENPSRTIPAALNIGIRSSRGEYVVRMDAHSSFGTDTLSKYVEYLRKSGADGVGGRIATVPCEKTMVGKGIALAMSEPFGVGNSRFRVTRDSAAQSEWTPVVVFPCLRREVFDRVGLFDENILRSEDMAMFQRMQRHGCRFLFVPSIVNCYYSRSDLKSFCKHAFDNGLWAILPTKYTGRVVVSLRHLIPLAFVAGVLILGVLSVFQSFFLLVLLLVIGTYLLASLGFSIAIARREGDIRYVAIMPMLFGMLHFGYGAGSLLGVAQVIPALRSMPSTRHSQTSG
jgi:cellulose synthase/poly-beta-1,6-N-acetylglucosamine synthase-like glycosyltransferase